MMPAERSSTPHVAALTYTDAGGSHRVTLSQETTTLGRSPDQTIALAETYVSRQHACIVFTDGGFEVRDLGSTHGTFVNGKRIEHAKLAPGDRLQLGSLQAVRMTFDLHTVEGREANQTLAMPDLLTSLRGMRAPSTAGGSAAQGMEQLNFLLSAARQLNAGGALDDILRALLELTLQLTGVERGYAFLVDETQTDSTNADGLRLALGLDASGKMLEEDSTISHNAIRSALKSDETFSISDTLSDDGAAGWKSVMVNQIRSIYCIPLRKHGSPEDPDRLLGLLYLDSQIASGGLGEVDHQVLDAIAREAAGLVHNVLLAKAEATARKAREELAIAAQIHQGLMQIELPVMPYAKLSARSVACLGIGGDFFDAVAVDDWVTLTIADVSGKGVSAAIVGATLQGIIHAQLLGRQSLTDIADLLNRFLCTRKVGKYVTLVMVKLFANGKVEYMNCGHVQPVLVSGGTMQPLTEHNTVAGLIPFAEYESASLTLTPGDRILLMTDGVTEAENAEGEMFGVEGLVALGATHSFDELFDAVTRFQNGTEAVDDCTMVELQYTGATGQ